MIDFGICLAQELGFRPSDVTKVSIGDLHFTDVDDVVDAVDQKVELCAVFPRIYPTAWGTFYSRDSECVQDLRIMLNISIFDFELTDDEMKQIAALDTGHRYENW